jgi:hypothetical protein
MTEKPSKSHKPAQKSIFQNQTVVITLITVAGAIITGIIAISPQLLSAARAPEPTATIIEPTATTFVPPTETPEPVQPTETITASPAPTDTPSPSPTPTPINPPISCLDRWQVISSNPELAETSGAGNCALSNIPDLGISASRNGIGIGINSFREQGTFGITTPLPVDATISLSVDLIVLTRGEFWIALSNTPSLENRMMILAFEPNSGGVRFYNDQTSRFSNKYEYRNLLTNTSLSSGPPYTYNITFRIGGNSVSPRIHFTNLPAQIVNLPKYLFIGYNNKSTLGSMTLQVEISDLVVEVE